MAKFSFILILQIICSLNYIYSTTYYVNMNGSDDNKGLDWGTSFKTIQKSIDISNFGDEIWVAKGIYYPTNQIGINESCKSFIIKPGIKLYGGFFGNEKYLNQRNVSINVTILSGDQGIIGDINDNSPIIYILGYKLKNSFLLDGFTLRDGNSDFDDFEFQGGAINSFNADIKILNCIFENNLSIQGGAINIKGGKLEISNCQFINNSASVVGGCICLSNCQTLIDNCNFTGNKAIQGACIYTLPKDSVFVSGCTFIDNEAVSGGAIFNASENYLSLEDCSFTSNIADRGGAITNYWGNSKISGCGFVQNKSEDFAGAIYNIYCNSTIENCKFTKNITSFAGTIYNLDGQHTIKNCNFDGNIGKFGCDLFIRYGELNVVNSLFIKKDLAAGSTIFAFDALSKIVNSTLICDSAATSTILFNSDSSETTIINSIVFNLNNNLNEFTIYNGSKFKLINSCMPNKFIPNKSFETINCVFSYPKFNLSNNNQYSLYSNSPCIDAGNNDYVNEIFDIRGNNFIRKLNKYSGLSGDVDIGAYEYNLKFDDTTSLTKKIIYVNSIAKGINNGENWENAYNSLQTALDNSGYGNEIWVAEGIYQPEKKMPNTTLEQNKVFSLKNGTTIFGGFPASGNPNLVDRNPEKYSTNLTGQGNKNIVYNTNIDSSSVIDGFIISNAKSSVLVNLNSDIIFRNCTMTNIAMTEGGGIINTNSKPKFLNCKIISNKVINGGGGIFNSQSSTEFVDCLISNNTANEGGGICEFRCTSKYRNCIISDNFATKDGTNVYLNQSTSEFTNCIISSKQYPNPDSLFIKRNKFSMNGGGFYLLDSKLTLANSIISNQITSKSGSSIYSVNSNSKIINSTIADNFTMDGGNIALSKGKIEIYNSILWNNQMLSSKGKGQEIINNKGEVIISNSCFRNQKNDLEGIITSNDCINSDPLFSRQNDEPYTLVKNSPCIDLGKNELIEELYDIRGMNYKRKLDGKSNLSGIVDLGAYEYNFNIDYDTPLYPVELLYPENNSILDSLTPTLKWIDRDYAINYQLQVSDNSLFENNIIVEPDIKNTNYNIGSQLELNKKYYWRVNAKTNNNDYGAWSKIWSFTVKNPVSVNEFRCSDIEFKYYENQFSIVINNENEILINVELFNILGNKTNIIQTYYQENISNYKADLTSGIYFVKITTNLQNKIFKILFVE